MASDRFFEGDKIDARALKKLIRAAVDYNQRVGRDSPEILHDTADKSPQLLS